MTILELTPPTPPVAAFEEVDTRTIERIEGDASTGAFAYDLREGERMYSGPNLKVLLGVACVGASAHGGGE